MKRSEINALIRSAARCFERQGWALPPNAVFEATDFGLGQINQAALVEVSLAAWPESGEKILYARKGMYTPAHCHKQKKRRHYLSLGRTRSARLAPCTNAAVLGYGSSSHQQSTGR